MVSIIRFLFLAVAVTASPLVARDITTVDSAKLVQILDTATANVKSTGSLGVLGGTAVLAQLQALVPSFLATLVAVGTKADSYAAIQGGKELVLADLKALNTASNNYLDAIIAAEPLLQKAGGIAIKTQITGAFTAAIGYYSVV